MSQLFVKNNGSIPSVQQDSGLKKRLVASSRTAAAPALAADSTYRLLVAVYKHGPEQVTISTIRIYTIKLQAAFRMVSSSLQDGSLQSLLLEFCEHDLPGRKFRSDVEAHL